MRTSFQPMIEIVPPGERGVAKIDHVEVSEFESRMSALRPGAYCRPGRYARLLVHGSTMMSDTDMEQRSNYRVLREARGDVLIAGLGIGMILVPILSKPEVNRVLVIEKYQDVIDLVGSHVAHSKLTIECADILEYKPAKGSKWNTIYFDIWPDICTDNLDEIATLKQRFKYHKAVDGWMGAWVEGELRGRRRSERGRGW